MTSTITSVCDVMRGSSCRCFWRIQKSSLWRQSLPPPLLLVTCSQLLFVTSPAVRSHAVFVHDVIDGKRILRVPVTLEDGRQLSLKRLAGARCDVIIGRAVPLHHQTETARWQKIIARPVTGACQNKIKTAHHQEIIARPTMYWFLLLQVDTLLFRLKFFPRHPTH